MYGSHLTVDFYSCNQENSFISILPAISCYDQDSGGYGDGEGMPAYTTMNWYCDQCGAWFNTQDAWNLGHNSKAEVCLAGYRGESDRLLIQGRFSQ